MVQHAWMVEGCMLARLTLSLTGAGMAVSLSQAAIKL